MSPKKIYDIPGQESLFADPAAVAIEPEMGISVTIESHNRNLIEALSHLAQVSKLGHGLQHAAKEPNYRPALEERYKDELPGLVQGANLKATNEYMKAKKAFSFAWGMYPLLSAAETGAEVNQIVDDIRGTNNKPEHNVDSWPAFEQTFGGSQGSAARDKYRNQLKRNQRNAVKR